MGCFGLHTENRTSIAQAIDEVSGQYFAILEILKNRSPLRRDFDASLPHQPLKLVSFRKAPMALHEIGHEIVIFQEEPEIRIPLLKLDRTGDNAVASRQAFFSRSTPEIIEVRKRY